jgi:hypothetical protein
MGIPHIIVQGIGYNAEFIPTLGFDSDWYLSIEPVTDGLLQLLPRIMRIELGLCSSRMTVPPRTMTLSLKPRGR